LRHLAHLAFDKGVHPELQGDILAGPTAQDDDRIVDRCERAAQLMAQHRKELVFMAIRADKLFDA
jgi:hypothetical protein